MLGVLWLDVPFRLFGTQYVIMYALVALLRPLISLPALFRPQGLSEVGHEALEVFTFNSFVEDLVAEAATISNACHQSSVLDLDGDFSGRLLPFLTSSITGSLLVKVKASLINKDELTFSFFFCRMIRQKLLEELNTLYLICLSVGLYLHP